MKKILFFSLIYGFLTSIVLMAISYIAAEMYNVPFFPFDIFDWMTRHLPAIVIETGIRWMVALITSLNLGPTDTFAKMAEQLLAMVMVCFSGIIFGLILGWLGIRNRARLQLGSLVGVLVLWAGIAFIEISLPTRSPRLVVIAWLSILITGWGWSLDSLIGNLIDRTSIQLHQIGYGDSKTPKLDDVKYSRRNLLIVLGVSLVSIFIYIFLRVKKPRGSQLSSASQQDKTPYAPLQETDAYDPKFTSGPAASPPLDVLQARINPASGTRSEITPTDQFYRIDINTKPPQIDGNSWHVDLSGLVEKPLSLTYDDIRSHQPITQAITQSCISNPVGGDLIGTSFITGVRLKDLLDESGISPQATNIAIKSADGYYEFIPVSEAMDERTILVYAMNGEQLSAEHGFPIRLFAPDHYGMKLPKWIIQLEATDKYGSGFWEDRGWSPTAIPETTSVIDTDPPVPTTLQGTTIYPLGGIAWSGERGISKVEIQIDDADWVEAVLRSPAVSPLTWMQWRYDWQAEPGVYHVRVRATDGEGNLQAISPTPPSPEGATGIFTAFITIT